MALPLWEPKPDKGYFEPTRCLAIYFRRQVVLSKEVIRESSNCRNSQGFASTRGKEGDRAVPGALILSIPILKV